MFHGDEWDKIIGLASALTPCRVVHLFFLPFFFFFKPQLGGTPKFFFFGFLGPGEGAPFLGGQGRGLFN